MIKATTQHGTYYIIDMEKGDAMRVKSEDRNEMYGDGDWFYFNNVRSFDTNTKEFGDDIEIGKPMYFNVVVNRAYDWRISTRVVSIEEYEG